MEPVENEGKTVAAAVDAALARMGLRRDQVEVEILREPLSGFMGLGVKMARVRLTEKRWGETAALAGRVSVAISPSRRASAAKPKSEEEEELQFPPHEKSDFPVEVEREKRARPARAAAPKAAPSPERLRAAVDPAAASQAAGEALREIIALAGFSAQPSPAQWDPQQERVKISLDGADVERLVGQDGQTIEALQFLLSLIVSRKLGSLAAVQVDARGYWRNREEAILSQARGGIDEVKRTGKPFRLAPMDPALRRLIHRSLADHPDVETISEGVGAWRKIVIRPRKR